MSNVSYNFSGQVALVSGAASGLGLETAKAFATSGAKVALVDIDEADFDRVIAVNLKGVWSAMKYQLIQMRKQNSGAIVNCSSLAGLVGGYGRPGYHAAKHGVVGLTRSVG